VLDRSLDLVEFLRAHCPWDAAQTHQSLRRYLIDEAHEVVDAIDAEDDDALRDELGDLLLNVAFQIVVAEERDAFDRAAVVDGLEQKMRRRHPHLYGGEHEAWDAIKARERGAEPTKKTLLGDLAAGRDALGHADRLQKRVAEVGFDWPNSEGAWEKVVEEVAEVGEERGSGATARLEEEIGDLLFAIVNFARLSGIHPSTALSRANAKFTRRFNRLEELAAMHGVVLGEASLEALDEVWNEVKREER
jgi:MazG family protein